MSESIRKRTINGVGWSFADSIVNQGVTFIVSLVLARILTPSEYGLIGIITIFIAIFNSIVDSGFSNALIRKANVSDIDYNTVFITNLLLSIILFSIMYLSAPLVAQFFNQTQLQPLTKAMSSIVLINAVSLIQRTIFIKKVDFKTLTKISVISSVISGIIGIVLALLGYGVWSLVGQQISRQFLNSLFLWIYSTWYPKIQFSIYSFKELFGFGWKLLVSNLIDTIWREIYQIVIGKCYNPATLGQYTRAQQFSSIFSNNLTTVVQRVSYPVLSEIQSDKNRLKNAYKRIIKVTMLVTFTCMLGLAAIAKPMILTLIGNQWLPAVPFLQIICLQMVLYPLHAINLNMLQVQGRSDLFLKLEIIKKIIAIGPLILGIFIDIYWMLWGGVLTGLISYYLNAIYSGRFLEYNVWEQISDILPSFTIAALMSLIVYAMTYINLPSYILLVILIFTGFILTIILCELFKIEPYNDIKDMLITYVSAYKNRR